MVAAQNIEIPTEPVDEFCRRWRVKELSLFGSVVRDDFRLDSDLDVLISFDAQAPWSLWDLIAMRDELQELFGRDVDLVEREALRNPFRRNQILTTREVIYGDGQA